MIFQIEIIFSALIHSMICFPYKSFLILSRVIKSKEFSYGVLLTDKRQNLDLWCLCTGSD